jgi:ABC-type transport system substrate-binding protein
VDSLFSAVTLIPQVAASAIYSQGQTQYPGTGSVGLSGQVTTTAASINLTNGLGDCVACALAVLEDHGYTRTTSGWENAAGKKLNISLGVGPSDLDHRTATLIQSYWAAIGLSTTIIDERSETSAALAAAKNHVDVALFARPTRTTPSYAARSWAGPPYDNTFPSGVRIAAVTALFDQASTVFNPVTASSTWLKLDQIIMNDYWVRPLFTAPSLAVWTNTLGTVQNSFSEAGFVDQLPTWSITPVVPTS